jgi:hypothetical protein
VTGQRIDVDGRAWRHAPGLRFGSWREIRWQAEKLATDREGDFELEYRVASPGDTPDTGWYLYGTSASSWRASWLTQSLKLASG